MRLVSSRANPQYKLLRLLAKSAHERRTKGCTILDGPHLVSGFIDRCGAPKLIVVSKDAGDDSEVEAVLARAGACPVLCLATELFRQLAPVETPVGILAVIDIPQSDQTAGSGDFAVMLEGVQDPGNVGTIIRSAAAAGADEVLLSSGCADAWSPRTLRAAMGAHFAIPVHTGVDLREAVSRFPGVSVAAVGDRGLPPHEVDLRGRVALLFGSEGAGLSEALRQKADVLVSIPMARGIESLSVGAAAAVVLFERVRQLSAKRSPVERSG